MTHRMVNWSCSLCLLFIGMAVSRLTHLNTFSALKGGNDVLCCFSLPHNSLSFHSFIFKHIFKCKWKHWLFTKRVACVSVLTGKWRFAVGFMTLRNVINPGQWFLKFELWINWKTSDCTTAEDAVQIHNDSMAVTVLWCEAHCPVWGCSGGVPSRGDYLAQHRLHRQCGLYPSHQQEAHRPALLTGWGEQVRRCGNLNSFFFYLIKDVSIYLLWSFIFLFLCHSFPHATDETLLAKFKQQHQGNKYFVPTPVMEPAFVIQHFAGKVKYQVKVRIMTILLFWLPLHPDWVYYKICISGLSGKEHGPHAFGHRGAVEEQRQRLRAPAHWHGPGGHVPMGDSASHRQRTGCFQRSGPGPGCQNVRCVIAFSLLAKWSSSEETVL